MIEDLLQQTSLKTILAGLFVVLASISLAKHISQERRIQALGGHAPKAKSYVFGIDQIIRAIYYGQRCETLSNVRRNLARHGQGGHTMEMPRGRQRLIFTAEPENIKAILATQFADYGKGESFHSRWSEFLGDSIFTTDGQIWHDSRQLIRPQFVKDRVSDLHTFERHGRVLIDAIANGGVQGVPGVAADGVAQGRAVDISDLFFRYTLDSSTDFLLGRGVGSLETPEQKFAEAFYEVQRVQFLIAGTGPFNGFVPRGSFRAGLRVINGFIDPFIDRALSLSPAELESKAESGSGYTFLHALAGYTRDRKVLRDQIIAVLLAGRDTTASTLSWTFFELARHPEIFHKLRQEIVSTVGTVEPPTYENLKQMKYLQYTMNETLRLYPIVPFNVRNALKDTTLPRGGGPDGQQPIGVLKGTHVGYSTLVMQRRADLYPPTDDPALAPESFNPDRWFGWQPKPWTYIPFNGGPRLCVGQQYALTNMGYTIVRMLQRFDRLESRMPGGPEAEPGMKMQVVLLPHKGVHVAFWESDKA